VIANTLTIAVLTIYFLLGLERGHSAAQAIVAGEHTDRNIRILDESLERIGGYVSGNIFISIIAGTLAFVVLEILGVPFAAALGVWVAIADLIPGVGAMLGAVVCVIVALFSSVGDGIAVAVYCRTGSSTWSPVRQVDVGYVHPGIRRYVVNETHSG
jgi:predicted PurR-regulated permease PerM